MNQSCIAHGTYKVQGQGILTLHHQRTVLSQPVTDSERLLALYDKPQGTYATCDAAARSRALPR